MNDFIAKAKQRPELARVTSTFQCSGTGCWSTWTVKRRKRWGCRSRKCTARCRPCSARCCVSQFNRSSRLWQVILQAEPSYRLKPGDLDQIFVRGKTGNMVPIKAVVTTKFVTGPDLGDAFQ
ncbi:efflux RND transporter permease subunit [Cupriavidus basilensis]